MSVCAYVSVCVRICECLCACERVNSYNWSSVDSNLARVFYIFTICVCVCVCGPSARRVNGICTGKQINLYDVMGIPLHSMRLIQFVWVKIMTTGPTDNERWWSRYV